MRRDIRRFILFVLFAAAILFVLDFAVGKGIETIYGKMKTGERARAHYAITRCKADVFVFGSSRAFLHYNPEVLEDSLNREVYNAGRPAQSILYHLAVLKMVLKRHTPEVVVLDVNENELVYEDRKYDILNSLLPYYFADEDVKQLISEVNPGYRYFSWSRTLPYNSSIFAILYRGLINTSSGGDLKGYIPNRGYHDETIETMDNCDEEIVIDSRLSSALKEFVSICRERNIKLYLFTSPRFTKYKCEKKDLSAVLKVLNEVPVYYKDFSSMQKYQEQQKLFNDAAHMNYEGSVEYSADVGHLLKMDLEKR